MILHAGEGGRDGDGVFCVGVCLDVAMHILVKKCEALLTITHPNSSSTQAALLCLIAMQMMDKGEIAPQTPLLPSH